MAKLYTATCGGKTPQRVFVLDDGSKWTVRQVQNQLQEKWKLEVSIHLARSRLDRFTDPIRIFEKPKQTRPKTLLTQADKDKEMELLKHALKHI